MLTTQTMLAVRVSGYGGPEQLKLEQVERPEPQAGEVLLRVHASGVNPLDWKIRQGLLKEIMPVTFPIFLASRYREWSSGLDLVSQPSKLGRPSLDNAQEVPTPSMPWSLSSLLRSSPKL